MLFFVAATLIFQSSRKTDRRFCYVATIWRWFKSRIIIRWNKMWRRSWVFSASLHTVYPSSIYF